ncbi:MAG: hypothetical protein WCE61_02815 [Candidatus Acidiferrum sp.]
MKLTKWISACAVGACLLTGNFAMAQGHGHGKGHKKQEDEDQGDHYYKDQDRVAIREWYNRHENHLPPGLARKDRLPPGLERQLEVRGTLPPGLQKRIQPCPEELRRRLPPPPPDCANVLIGGHIVLLNRRTNLILAVFHFEIP